MDSDGYELRPETGQGDGGCPMAVGQEHPADRTHLRKPLLPVVALPAKRCGSPRPGH